MGRFIAPLEPHHEVKKFDCGVLELNTWLRTIARQHKKKRLSQTFVLVEGDSPTAILGFYTLAPRGMTAREQLPLAMAKRLPLHVPGYTLARLAVASYVSGRGYGADLLIDAIVRIKGVSTEAGGPFLFVDAKDQNSADFYAKYGFIPLPDAPLTLLIPLIN